MIAETTFTPEMNDTYREYAALRVRRHFLLLEGSDGEEHEEIEDRLTSLWENLDDVQRRSLSGMGSDLNWLRRGGEPPPKGTKEKDITEEDQRLLEDAFARKNWHAVLHHLRTCAAALLPESVAYNRASCYHWIDLDNVAALFYDFTAATSPTGFATASMQALYRLDPPRAATRAAAIISSPLHHPPLVVALCTGIATEDLKRNRKPIDSRFFILLLQETAKRLRREPCTPQIEAMFARYSGTTFHTLGYRKEALVAFQEGLTVLPDDMTMLVRAGVILYLTDRKGAVEYLQRARKLKSTQFLTYFYLAHYFMAKREFVDAMNVIQESWQLEMPGSIRAELLSWIAISQHEVGFPTDAVLALFERAIEIDPLNDRISKNYRAFKEKVALPGISDWEPDSDDQIQYIPWQERSEQVEPIGC